MRTEKCMLAMAGDERMLDRMIASGNWHFERKFDGERGVLEVGDAVRLYNRKGKEINDEFPEVVEMGSRLPKGLYDGEIYVEASKANKDKPTTSGRTSVRPSEAKILAKIKPATFKCFDVLEFEGKDVRGEAYEGRKEILSRIRNVPGFDAIMPETNPREVWQQILASADEGFVAKRVGSTYQNVRSADWVKLKTWKEEDFKVVGFTSDKREISALVLENGMKVNCSLTSVEYDRLMSDLVKSGEMMTCSDGTTAKVLTKTYVAKVKFVHKSATGLRTPVLHGLEGYKG